MFIDATAIGAAVGGPVGAIIGAVIDLGALFYGIFGGGSGGPPSAANFPFPNLGPTAGPGDGALGQFGIDNFTSVTSIDTDADWMFSNFPVWFSSILRKAPGACTAQIFHGSYPVTSPFGAKDNAEHIATNGHAGRDYGTPIGTPIYAPEAGTVGWAQSRGTAGIMVGIQSPAVNSFFEHLSRTNVTNGQAVSPGKLVGWSGNTGDVVAHLHFEQRTPGSLFSGPGSNGRNGGNPIEPCR
jgi:murein DD-endopeptidase MepM/ murein hydrolase activator NlpD